MDAEPRLEPAPRAKRTEQNPEPRPRDRGGLWMDPDEAERIDRERGQRVRP